ncbi:hypothetical protein Spico_0028 [Parasphaerochaeta coccoides DSM 17374]|uniref:Uncharacterized protein n=1 Tax=Parasphaerochaeta coccoides (strain ATCC BAA-1237 / DSM 17374 / SPN1) TaxID=760011 RepID=F4GIB1_PARC1|nr:hypothetical protein Spico_0028 [Parasphaerochaeta coccoides DSM 17374]
METTRDDKSMTNSSLWITCGQLLFFLANYHVFVWCFNIRII